MTATCAHVTAQELHGTRLLYFVDDLHSDRFRMVFAAVRQANWAAPSVLLEHVPIGLVTDVRCTRSLTTSLRRF